MNGGAIVVTGSASGMGAATVARLRSRGENVIGIDLARAEVDADLGRPAGRSEAARSVEELSGGLVRGIVAFAGVSGFGNRSGSLVASVNYFGTVELLLSLRPLLARVPDAAVVAVSSNAATTARGVDDELVEACLRGDEAKARARGDELGGPAAYAASKLALARWVRRVATSEEWIGSGITLNAIAPGKVETPLVAEMREDPAGRAVLDRLPVPAGRGAQPDEIAGVAEFLLSADARFLVGSVILVDGGTEAHIRPDDWPAARAARRPR